MINQKKQHGQTTATEATAKTVSKTAEKKSRKLIRLKWAATALAGVIFGVGSTLIISEGVRGRSAYEEGDKKTERPVLEVPPDEQGGATIEQQTNNGVKLMSTKIPKENYAEYGVSTLAETAYTLTATIVPTDAINQQVDWTIAFKDANSSWAKGRKVTDYVTLTPAADGALTAVVENLAEFGEQIVVKVTSRDNPDACATCTVEYLQRTLRYVFVAAQVGNNGSPFYQIGADNNFSAEIKLDFSYDRTIQPYLDVRKSSVYTRANTDEAKYYTMKPTADFLNSLKSITTVTPTPKSFEGGVIDGRLCEPIEFFSKSWGESIYGTTSAAINAKNQLIRILKQDYGHYNNFDSYEIIMYDKKGGTELATYWIHFDLSAVENLRVESVEMDDAEVVF